MRFATLFGVAALGLFLLPAVASAELLVNPDMEGTIAWNFVNQAAYSTAVNHTTGGSQSIQLSWDTTAFPGANQFLSDSSWSAGDAYTASVYGYLDAPLDSGRFLYLAVASWDASYGFLGQNQINDVLVHDSPTTTWIKGTLTGTIPMNAVHVSFVFGGVAVPGDGGSHIYVDDASFTVVPEPASLSLLGAAGLFGLLAYAWRKRSK